MLLTSKIEETYTVEDFIELGKEMDDVQYSKFAIFSKASDDAENSILYATHNLIYDYEAELKNAALTVDMTDSEYAKYRFKPKLLAYDVYGSTEIFFVLLFINGMISIKDFDRKTIKLLKKDDMITILEAIFNAEQNYLMINRSDVGYV